MSLLRITAVDYTTVGDDDPEPVVKVVGRDENRKRRVHHVYGTEPHLYVLEDEELPDKHAHRVVREEGGYAATDPRNEYHGSDLKKWVCRVPDDVGEIAGDIEETWESDIPYYRRCSIDHDLSGYVDMPEEREVHVDDIDTDIQPAAEDAIEPRVVYGDIEVLPSGESVSDMLEEAKQPIVAITLYDNYDDQYDIYALDPEGEIDGGEVKEHLEANQLDTDEHDVVMHYSGSEEGLLDSFLGYFEDHRPDMTTGWNWVDFDILYLLRRIKRLHDEDTNNLDLNRLSDAGGTKRNFSDYHGDLARAIIGVPAVDMLKMFRERIEFSEWRSWSLDYVAEEVVGHGKISDVNVHTGYEEHRSKLAAYNAVDVQLCVEIDEQRDILETCMGLAEESQVQIYDVFSEMRLVDGYIMARADDDEVLPVQEESDIPENAGGLVLQPATGIKEWVGVMDLKSLYPSSMITWNISPETVDWQEDFDGEPDLTVPWVPEAGNIGEDGEYDYPVTEDDVQWDVLGTTLEEEGIVPKYLKLLFDNREEAKATRDSYEEGSPQYETWDRRQYGLKVLMNSFYGVSSNDYWRLAKHGLGDAITSASRYALFKGEQIVKRIGYDTIYGDTDSVFIDLTREDGDSLTEDEYVDKTVLDGKGLTSQVNSSMEEAIRESGLEGDHPFLTGMLPHETDSHCLYYEFEKLYRRYIQFGKKKRYAGLIRWKEGHEVDKTDITGFEAKRSDVPELAAEAQKKVLHKVLGGEGFDGVSSYVSGLCDDIQAGTVDLPRIARPKSIAQPKDEYSNPNNQVLRACRFSEEQLGHHWAHGDDPWLVYLKDTPPMTPTVSVIALEWNDDLPEGYEIDAEEHIRICLEAPLEPILDEVGWGWKEVKTGAQAGDAMEGDWGSAEESDEEFHQLSQKTQEGGGGASADETEPDESGSSNSALEADW